MGFYKQYSFNVAIGPTNGRPDWIVESIDQHVKMPEWIYKFEQLGGNMLYETADIGVLPRHLWKAEVPVRLSR